jgi:4-amino-4-deoxy-L-arabinose transferase-like glycosyltransferase
MKLFGVTEGAARLPSLLLGLSIVYMILRLGRYRHNKDVGLLSSVILFTMPLFYLAAGTVMTDMALVFSVSLCFVSFWITITTDNKSERGRYGWLFFVGLGLGLLAKGPICGVMTLFPILFWVLKSNHNLLSIWQKIPWIKGTILMLLIAVPWYVLSEQSTPGFLKYFLLGEHFYRFLVPGWSGDLYGFAHQQPLGTVWLFWVAAVLPWSLVLSWWLITKYRVIPSLFKDQDGWLWYLFLWAIWPMIFFTFSRNIIWPYVITSLPASALLIAELLHRYGDHKKRVSVTKYSYWLWVPLLMSAFSLSGVVAISLGTTMGQYTQKPLLQE